MSTVRCQRWGSRRIPPASKCVIFVLVEWYPFCTKLNLKLSFYRPLSHNSRPHCLLLQYWLAHILVLWHHLNVREKIIAMTILPQSPCDCGIEPLGSISHRVLCRNMYSQFQFAVFPTALLQCDCLKENYDNHHHHKTRSWSLQRLLYVPGVRSNISLNQ